MRENNTNERLTKLTLVKNRTMKCGRSYSLPRNWEAAVDSWITWMRLEGCSEATLRTRRSQIRVIADRSGTDHPCEITLNTLVQLCGRRGLSADARHGQRAALVSFFQWCTNNGVVESSPAQGLPAMRSAKPKPRPVPDDIWADLIAKASPRAALIALLACEAGLRRNEVAQLHYNDLTRDADGWILIVNGKGDKQRIVPITAELAMHIRGYCKGGFVFPGQIDGHLSADAVGRDISRLMPPGWTMHKLRHRYATNGYGGTKNLRAVQEALGHASLSTTQHYTAVTLIDIRGVSVAAAQRNMLGNDKIEG